MDKVSVAACWPIDRAADIRMIISGSGSDARLVFNCAWKRLPLYVPLDRMRKLQSGCIEKIFAVILLDRIKRLTAVCST